MIKQGRRKKIQRIGIFGGTFNPPHKAHIGIARKAMKQFLFDRIIFIPAYIPPHKMIDSSASATDRLMMVKLAIRKEKGLAVSSIELKRGGISYTIDTLQEIKKKFPNADIKLIIGADNLAQFKMWRSQKTILQLASLIVYKRPGYGAAIRRKDLKFQLIKGISYQMSSTDIRTSIMNGKSVKNRLQRPVWEYIKRHSLYVNNE